MAQQRMKGRGRDRRRHAATHHSEVSAAVLGREGLSIFRPTEHPSLDLVSNIFRTATGGLTRNRTGRDGQKPMAIHLLNADEVRNQAGIGRLDVTEAQSRLYGEVESLRRKSSFYIGRVSVLEGAGPVRPVAILPDEPSRSQFAVERREILDVLEDMGEGVMTSDEFNWFRKMPMILLGRVSMEMPRYELGRLIGDVEGCLPEMLPIERATLV